MGRYIDWSHVCGRYKDASGFADASAMGSYWISHAEAEVDGRLAVRYTVPFANTPTLAPLLVQDLAIDVTYQKLNIAKKKKAELAESLKSRFEGLLNGTILITDANGPIQSTGNLAWNENSYHTSFGMDNPVNWRVDSQSIEDVQNARGQFNGFFGY